MPSLYLLGLVILLIKMANGISVAPLICLTSPAVPIQAGSTVAVTIDNPQGHRCDAQLRFADPDFLDVHFGFNFLKCMGSQTAQFTVPLEVPNGDAFILWECAGESSRQCNHVLITQGTVSSDTIVYNQMGDIDCVVPTAIITTLSTVIGTSTTLIEPEIEIEFSTSFLPSSAGTTPGTTSMGNRTGSSTMGSATTNSIGTATSGGAASGSSGAGTTRSTGSGSTAGTVTAGTVTAENAMRMTTSPSSSVCSKVTVLETMTTTIPVPCNS